MLPGQQEGAIARRGGPDHGAVGPASGAALDYSRDEIRFRLAGKLNPQTPGQGGSLRVRIEPEYPGARRLEHLGGNQPQHSQPDYGHALTETGFQLSGPMQGDGPDSGKGGFLAGDFGGHRYGQVGGNGDYLGMGGGPGPETGHPFAGTKSAGALAGLQHFSAGAVTQGDRGIQPGQGLPVSFRQAFGFDLVDYFFYQIRPAFRLSEQRFLGQGQPGLFRAGADHGVDGPDQEVPILNQGDRDFLDFQFPAAINLDYLFHRLCPILNVIVSICSIAIKHRL